MIEENTTLTQATGEDAGVKKSAAGTPKKRVKTTTSKLTAAEDRVLSLVSQAKTNKEIASALGISPATVKRHLENILGKFQLRNRVEAAIYGLALTGCSRRPCSDCPLEQWQKERLFTEENWAD